jgi:hypothetical protein
MIVVLALHCYNLLILLCVQFMDLNNDQYLDFNEFSRILVGSMRAEFRVR